jgi:hypothetical protein
MPKKKSKKKDKKDDKPKKKKAKKKFDISWMEPQTLIWVELPKTEWLRTTFEFKDAKGNWDKDS